MQTFTQDNITIAYVFKMDDGSYLVQFVKDGSLIKQVSCPASYCAEVEVEATLGFGGSIKVH